MKKRVSLDIFEESVLPQLQVKFPDIAALQKAIDDGYEIYETTEENGETKEHICKFTVAAAAITKAAEKPKEEPDISAIVKSAVDKAIADTKAASGGLQQQKAPTIPAEVKRTRAKNFIRETIGGFDPEERAYRFGQWALAAAGSAEAKAWCDGHGIKLASEGTNTAGGYLVPEEFSSDLINLKEVYGVSRRLFQRVPMGTDTLKIPRRVGGLTSYFVGEGAAGTESTMTWDQIQLVVKDLMVLTRMTAQVNADSVINWSDMLAFECSYANTLKEDQCAFTGLATSTYGGITGVGQALTNKWTAATAGTINGITKASSTTIASLALADFESAVGSLPQYAQAAGPVWVCHTFFYYSTMLRLALAAGGNAAMEINTGNRAPRPIFLGYPVEFSQVMPSATAATTLFAFLGAFQLGATFGDRQQDSIAFSAEASVGGQSMWERNELGVRCTERFDIIVHDVGDGTTPGPIVAVATG